MKNLLIATTALVATAGMAAAEINFSGGARFGVVHTGSVTTAGTDEIAPVIITESEFLALEAAVLGAVSQAAFETAVTALIAANLAVAGSAAVEASTTESSSDVHNRFTLNIDGTAETDSGVEFFARVRIRGSNTGTGATSGSAISAPRVGATMGGLTVAVGNINGAVESMPGLYSGNVGLTGLGWGSLPTNHSGAGPWGWDAFSSAGGGSNGVEVIYSSNGFGVHVSHSGASDAARTAINVSYNFSDWTVALGHQSSDTALQDTTILTVGGTIGNVGVGFAHADNEGDNDATRVNATFEVGAGTKVTAYYTAVSRAGREDSYGLGFTHSLGGATLAGGVANSFTGQTVADLGVRFNF
jgi:outer membrane protein OmpU